MNNRFTQDYQRQKTSASDYVISVIRDELLNKRLKPGEQLPSETELAAQLEVSRSTVREAMRVLMAYGVVEIRRGKGTFICEESTRVSEDSTIFSFLIVQPTKREQMEFRAIMERIVFELAIKNATQDDIDALTANYENMPDMESDPEKSVEVDLEFHRLLGEATKNRMVARVYNVAMEYIRPSLISSHRRNWPVAAEKTHRRILDAINNRDTSSADKLAQESTYYWIVDADEKFF